MISLWGIDLRTLGRPFVPANQSKPNAMPNWSDWRWQTPNCWNRLRQFQHGMAVGQNMTIDFGEHRRQEKFEAKFNWNSTIFVLNSSNKLTNQRSKLTGWECVRQTELIQQLELVPNTSMDQTFHAATQRWLPYNDEFSEQSRLWLISAQNWRPISLRAHRPFHSSSSSILADNLPWDWGLPIGEPFRLI